MNMRPLRILFLLLACSPGLFAQTGRGNIYAPFASRLAASANGNEVVLSWQDSPSDDNLVYAILRHDEEISSANFTAADRLALVAPGVRVYTDRPDTEREWWYAVVSVREGREIEVFIPWRNSLGAPVSFREDDAELFAAVDSLTVDEPAAYAGEPMRHAPLPGLRIETSPIDGSVLDVIDGVLPERQNLEPEVSSALAGILGPTMGTPWYEPEPIVLDIETAPTADRIQSALNSIIAGPFAGRDWFAAESSLFDLSARNGLDSAARARVQFYLGQCYYFTGRYRRAFLAFLTASDTYYPEARVWIVRIYSDLLPVG